MRMRKWLISAVLLSAAFAAHAQEALTISGTKAIDASGKTVPTLTWSTSGIGATCLASGGWSGTKAGQGTEVLAPISVNTSYVLACNWPADTDVQLAWTPPTQNTDGTAYANAKGYRIKYGLNAAALDKISIVDSPATTTRTIGGLTPGTWNFVVLAESLTGALSAPSTNVPVVMPGGSADSKSVAIAVDTIPGKIPSVTVTR